MARLRAPAACLALAALLLPPSAEPCAVVPPPDATVDIASEDALIVWNAARHRETFIRRADFITEAKDFGFLVPTPSVPELAEAPDEVFNWLDDATQPPVQRREGYNDEWEPVSMLQSCVLSKGNRVETLAAPPRVRVLREQQVGSYHAAVLEADDLTALNRWLQENGYPAGEALTLWMTPYFEAGWKLTAFKFEQPRGGAPGHGLGTKAIQLTFDAEKPFYPYREPSRPRRLEGERLLRLWFFSEGAPIGTFKHGDGRSSWPGKLVYSRPYEGALKDLVPGLAELERPWLAELRDASSPRPAEEDVYFAVNPHGPVVTPQPVVIDARRPRPLPVDFIGVALLMAGVLFLRGRRER